MKRTSMNRTFVALALVAVGAFISAPAMAEPDDDKKVSICHFPPGNPDNVQFITVSVNAFENPHEKHNDFEASSASQCRGDDDDDDDDGDNGDNGDNGDKNGGGGDADSSSSDDGTLADTGA